MLDAMVSFLKLLVVSTTVTQGKAVQYETKRERKIVLMYIYSASYQIRYCMLWTKIMHFDNGIFEKELKPEP